MSSPVLSECPGPVGTTSVLTEEQMTTMSPTAAAVSKIKPGMKLTEVYRTKFQHSSWLIMNLSKGLIDIVTIDLMLVSFLMWK